MDKQVGVGGVAEGSWHLPEVKEDESEQNEHEGEATE